MKKAVIILLITASVLLILCFVYPGYGTLYALTFQNNKDRYISYVTGKNFEKSLGEDPLFINDKAYKNKELAETDFESITAFREDIHGALLEKYPLRDIATGETDFEKALQILSWLTENTFYNGMQLKRITDNSVELLDFSFGKGFSYALNCRHKAIIFADCLVAAGIKAYPVCMISGKYKNNHFTCMAYIKELDDWCLFDPSFGCWFGYEGKALDVLELRELFLENKNPVVEGYNFNSTQEGLDVYINRFMKQNMSNLSTWQDNTSQRRDTKSPYGRKMFASRLP